MSRQLIYHVTFYFVSSIALDCASYFIINLKLTKILIRVRCENKG